MAFELPPLPYEYDSLEPFIDAQTMHLHHDKHHQAYVDKLNAAVEGTEWADKTIDELITSLSDLPRTSPGRCATTAAATQPHLFWEWMSGDGGGAPEGELAAAIDDAFGTFEDFKTKFDAAGVARFGSGWVWLVSDGSGLSIVSTANQDTPPATARR